MELSYSNKSTAYKRGSGGREGRPGEEEEKKGGGWVEEGEGGGKN